MMIPSGRHASPQQQYPDAGNGSAGTSGSGAGAGTGAGSGTDMPHRTWTQSDDTNRSEFGAFLDDLSDLASSGGQSPELREELERRVHMAREQLRSALDQGMEMSARARESMHEGIDYTRGVVSERPLIYVAAAAGVGLLLGMLISSRR
jgi:ElaB/YqjD/DUF883 family membrane-anchored ribosome-binding protein